MASPPGDETISPLNADTHIRDPLVGTRVDDYDVKALLGQGAMGIVYRAEHAIIGRQVAIKVLKPDFAEDPEMVSRLIREARTVAAIRHPGIVDVFGFGQLKSTGQPFIVMDYLKGEPLDLFVRHHAPMKLPEAAAILDELLSALGAAHAVGVIHRDLKPGNILLEQLPDGKHRLKLLDFGLARQADKAGGSVKPTNPGTILGTPSFMAPEQIRGTKITPATDLYAVGGIAYQLLTGHLPHEGGNAIEVLSAKLKYDPIRLLQWQPLLPAAMDAWVMGLLDRDETRRPQTAEAARRSLQALLETAGKARGTGVVPARSWSDSDTVVGLDDGLQDPNSQGTTDQYSPYVGPPPELSETRTQHEEAPVPRPSVPEPTVRDVEGSDDVQQMQAAMRAKLQAEAEQTSRLRQAPAAPPGPGEVTTTTSSAAPAGSRTWLWVGLGLALGAVGLAVALLK